MHTRAHTHTVHASFLCIFLRVLLTTCTWGHSISLVPALGVHSELTFWLVEGEERQTDGIIRQTETDKGKRQTDRDRDREGRSKRQ